MKMHTKLGAVAMILALPLAACDVDQTEEGELPDVEVEGEAELPEYDVETEDIEVGTDTTEIEYPDVDVGDDEGELRKDEGRDGTDGGIN